MKFYTNIILIIIGLSFSQDWSMTIIADDNEDIGASDYIILGMCNECHDGFHFGEDEYDLGTPPGYNTDISFFNYDWIDDVDDNGNSCSNPEFYIDKRHFHEPIDLLIWNVNGITNLPESANVILSWDEEEIFALPLDYQIYLYVNDNGYNMRTTNEILISQDQLQINYDPVSQEFFPNIKVLIGACANEGLTTYYYDNDGDGYGGNLENSDEFCAGFQPDNWVDNNDDINDDIYCLVNIIDQCNVCDGANECLDCDGLPWGTAQIDNCGICSGGNTNHLANSDMDCNNICFGNAEIDGCGICSGGNTNHLADSDMDCNNICFGNAEIDGCGICDGLNQSCLNEIFLSGPSSLYAYINDSIIELTWDQINYPENENIIGFNIYRNNEYLAFTTNEQYIVNEFSDGEFCVSAFDQYNNESQINCTIATNLQEFCWVLSDGLNLISYPILPLDITVNNIFSTIEEYVVGIISQGDAASLLPNGLWAGSLIEIENYRSYWVKLDLGDPFATQEYCIVGYPVPLNLEYNLSQGANLISYLGNNNALIIDALNNYNGNFTAIIGSASAAYNSSTSGWVGSLTNLQIGDGYWVIVNSDFEFYWFAE